MTADPQPSIQSPEATHLPQASSRPADKADLSALTGLRFFAALAVVLYHFIMPVLVGWPSPLQQLAGSGFVAVSFFYLLSGFILAYSYILPDGQLRGDRKAFYLARFARIYPAYFLAFMLAAPHNIATSLHVSAPATAAARLAFGGLSYLSLQQAWTPWTAWCWNYPAWSVSVEAFFYLLFPFIAPRLVSRLSLSSCLRLCGGLWLLSLVAPAALVLLTGASGPPEVGTQLVKVVEFTPLLRLPEFLIGILLGRAFSLGFFHGKISSVMVYLSATAIVCILAIAGSIPHSFLANGLMVPLFAALLLGLATRRTMLSAFLSQPPLVVLGEASYGLYILQIPVSYLVGMPPPSHSFLQFGIYLMALIAASLLSWRFVENPCRAYLRSRFAGKKSSAAALGRGREVRLPVSLPELSK